MNLRPSGYEPDELPGCSTPRFVVAKVAAALHGARLFSVFVDGEPAGADEGESEEDERQFHGMGIVLEVAAFRGRKGEGGDKHGEGEQQADGAVAKAEEDRKSVV